MTRLMLALAVATLLSACGIKGGLDRPDPMWNSEAAIRRDCATAAQHNRPQDPRCAQYQSGAAASRETTPSPNAPPATPTQPSTTTPPATTP